MHGHTQHHHAQESVYPYLGVNGTCNTALLSAPLEASNWLQLKTSDGGAFDLLDDQNVWVL